MSTTATETRNLAGKTVEVTQDGFLVNASDWTEEMAPELASHVGIDALTDRHWEIINFMRQDTEDNGKVPTLRRIKKTGGVPMKEIYQLFPDGPAKKAAYIAGLSKPEGCV